MWNNRATLTIALVVPMWNAEQYIPDFFDGILQQTLQPGQILVIDSSSTDNTCALLSRYPVKIHTIAKNAFDHGGTRRLATELVNADIYIFMTQDAILAQSNSFENLINVLLAEDEVGCAYGRQLPKKSANPLSVHGRLCNYPEKSYVYTYADREKYGIKICFNSDNLAAYKKAALQQAGGFPKHLITAEDAYVAAKMLLQGYKISYAADALIYHSHNLNLRQEFHRYFSLGVCHSREHWMLEKFSSAHAAGIHFVFSELCFLWKQKQVLWMLKALVSTIVKYGAYKMGLLERWIPWRIKKNWGINPSFWYAEKTV